MRGLLFLGVLILVGCGGGDGDDAVTTPESEQMSVKEVINAGGVPDGKDVTVTLQPDEVFTLDGTDSIVVKGRLTIK